jgi:septin family protein
MIVISAIGPKSSGKSLILNTLFGTNSSIGVSLNKVKAHIESLDAYLESGFISDIRVLGYEIENIYGDIINDIIIKY